MKTQANRQVLLQARRGIKLPRDNGNFDSRQQHFRTCRGLVEYFLIIYCKQYVSIEVRMLQGTSREGVVVEVSSSWM